ncbi:unnamed protein product [Camellia sinensis]
MSIKEENPLVISCLHHFGLSRTKIIFPDNFFVWPALFCLARQFLYDQTIFGANRLVSEDPTVQTIT